MRVCHTDHRTLDLISEIGRKERGRPYEEGSQTAKVANGATEPGYRYLSRRLFEFIDCRGAEEILNVIHPEIN